MRDPTGRKAILRGINVSKPRLRVFVCLFVSALAVMLNVSCEEDAVIEGPAVEFVIHYESDITDVVAGFKVYVTGSDFPPESPPGSLPDYCNPEPGFEYGPDELAGKSIVIHGGNRFHNEAALRIEGRDTSETLAVSLQAQSVFPVEGFITVPITIDSSCLNISCSEDGLNYTIQCDADEGTCRTDATPAAGVFMDGGPIEEDTPCQATD